MIRHDIHESKGPRLQVLHTTDRLQLATMTLKPGHAEESEEGNAASDQIVYMVEGRTEMTLGDETRELRAGETVLVPQGTPFRMVAVGRRPATFFTVYGPPVHPAQAEEARGAEDGDEMPALPPT